MQFVGDDIVDGIVEEEEGEQTKSGLVDPVEMMYTAAEIATRNEYLYWDLKQLAVSFSGR
jgi:hypothetical protein